MRSYLLLSTIVAPAIAAMLIASSRSKTAMRAGWIAIASLLYTTLALCAAGLRVHYDQTVYEDYFSVGTFIHFDFFGDGLSIPVAIIINLLCMVLAFYSIDYVKHRIEIIYGERGEAAKCRYYKTFFFLYLFFPVGFLGVCFSTNLLAIYFFLELLPIPLYFIMAYFGYVDRVRVALMCLLWGIIGANLFLVASLLSYFQIGTFDVSGIHALAGNPITFWIILLFLVGLATKLAMFPFHVWMPWVHAEHPTCIAGLLAVYGNLGAYLLLRIIILPLHDDFKIFSVPLMVAALITMVYGSLLTMAQTDVKRFAACSTISQISFSILGLAAYTWVSIEGGIFFFLSHIMGKTILFSTAGILVYVTGIRDMRKMGGLASRMPLTFLLWLIGSMMLSGFPPFSTFTAEWIMFTGIFQYGIHAKPVALVVAVLAVCAILLTITYTFWSVKRIFYCDLGEQVSESQIKDPPLSMSLPLLFVAAVSVFLFLCPGLIMNPLNSVIAR